MPARRQIALTDVVVVVGMFATILALAARTVHNAGEQSNRIRCMSNLKQIGMALLLYANDNKGLFPRTRATFDPYSTNQFTGARSTNPFGPGGPEVNDVTTPLMLLLRTQFIKARDMVCPSTGQEPWDYEGKSAKSFSNFLDDAHLSYSVANPYPDRNAANSGYKWNNGLWASFAVAADMNPGDVGLLALAPSSPPERLRLGNSNNHSRGGQNVLYGDGHAEWADNPFAGCNRDNIYTVGDRENPGPASTALTGSPASSYDSILLPVGSAVRRSGMGMAVAAGIGIGFVALIAGVLVLLMIGRKKRLTAAAQK